MKSSDSVVPLKGISKEYSGLALQLTSSVGITAPFPNQEYYPIPETYYTSALWDTGATHCLITKALAKSLKLTIHDYAEIEHHD